MEEHNLINTLVISLSSAFVFGLIAKKLRLPAIFGYLLAGIMIGPYTPGFVADIGLARQLAEIGIILLMFGVGTHFSLSDLSKVKNIAVPGALFQMAAATVIGLGVGMAMGFDMSSSLIFGFSLSVASTIVLLRALEAHKVLNSESGKIAVGWLIVEDIAMVLALVLLPVFATMMNGSQDISITAIITEVSMVMLKIAGFATLMIFFGRKILPQVLVLIAQLRSRELLTLGTLAIALGFAYLAYAVFDASFALGAFLAGLVLSESEIGQKAAEQSLPMRDAFAVLFFVSVGMLFDPMTLLQQPVFVLLTLGIIIIGKTLAALCITALFKQSKEISYTIALSLAQIGEFSFILAGMALTMDMIPQALYNLILAGALLSIAVNPFLFKLLERYLPHRRAPHAPH
ncbi:MAG: cation:proton antiporter [Pseudomonadota bacterium]